jgi:hypothetical protein
MTTTQLSRREVLSQGLQISAIAAVFLTGCGGFLGGGGSGTSALVSGNLTVPPGLAETDLLVVGLGKVGQVTAGAFQTAVDTGAPSWVFALHAPTGKVVGMGIFDIANHSPKLDATSAAEALLFMALDGSALPRDGRKTLFDLIHNAPATATLATVIQGLLATDPYALETASSTLQNAIATAVNDIIAQNHSAQHTRSTSQGSDTQNLGTLMLIEPSNEVDGLTVVQDASVLGFEVQNARRRNSLMYTYLVAHVDASGNRTDITPQQIGDVLNIPATKSLLNLSSGWHPVTTPVVPLKLQGQDKKSIYESVALNVVFGANDPAIYGLNKYAGVVDQWKQDVRNLHAGMVLSYVTGIIFDAIGIGGLTFGIAELTATIANLTQTSSNFVSLLVGAQDGYALIPLTKAVIQKFLTGSFLSPDGLKVLQPLLEKAEGQVARDLAAGQASSSVYVAIRAAMRIFLAVGVIGLGADLVAIGKDTSLGERGDLFTITLFDPKVTINPASGTYAPGFDKSIEATAPGVPQSHLSYHWTLSGSNLANLSDGTHVGIDFTSTSKTVNLATTPSTQGNLTISVIVTDTTTSTVIGTATATYSRGTVEDTSSALQVRGPSTYHPQGGGNAIVFYPVPLTGTQVVKHVSIVHDDWGSVTYNVKMPVMGTPISPSTPLVASQDFGGTAGVVNGTITNMHIVGANGNGDLIGQQGIFWVNYGDNAWLIVAVADWDNRGSSSGFSGSSGEALQVAKGYAAKWHVTIT